MDWLNRFRKKTRAAGSVPNGAPNAVAPVLKVSDFLGPKHILFFPAGPSKQQALGSLIGALELPDTAAALQAILSREEAGSTVIAPGLALPHARIAGINRIAAALGISQTGVVDPRAEGPIHIFVLFLGPSNNMKQHLAFLAGVSALFQAEGLLNSLLPLTSPETVLERLKQTESALP